MSLGGAGVFSVIKVRTSVAAQQQVWKDPSYVGARRLSSTNLSTLGHIDQLAEGTGLQMDDLRAVASMFVLKDDSEEQSNTGLSETVQVSSATEQNAYGS